MLSLDPQHPRARYNLGACLYLAGRRTDALIAFRQALAEDPSDQRAAQALQRMKEGTAS